MGADLLAHIWSVPSLLVGVVQAIFSVYVFVIAYSILVSNREPVVPGDGSAAGVAVVMPLYKESAESVERTVRSLITQDYPLQLLKIYYVIEEGDPDTEEAVEEVISRYGSSVQYDVIRSRCREAGKGKACAMNEALKHVREEVVVIFDADDEVPRDYISRAVSALGSGYAAASTKVYRVGDSLISKFLGIDTVLWYDAILPALARLSGGIFPMSGEGSAYRTEFLKKLGGFPDSLTEDAAIAVEIAEAGGRIAYIGDKHIVEKAPRDLGSFVRQRIRWVQGFYECLGRLLSVGVRRGLRAGAFASLLIAFFSPVVSSLTALSHTLFITYWVSRVVGASPIYSAFSVLFPPPIFYWSLINLVVGNVYILYLTLYLLSDTEAEELAPYVGLVYIYWYFLGFVSAAAAFMRREWRKTVR